MRYIYQIRDKLEVKYFDRKYIIKVFNDYTSFSYFLFINNFEIYYNIYRALKVFYLILVYLIYKKRRKLVNIFILILKSYKVNIYDITKVFSRLI